MSVLRTFQQFFKLNSAAGIMLIAATLAAIVIANSSFSIYYNWFVDTLVKVQIGEFIISKPLILWINDGLMAIFFFLIGLELKYEWIEGQFRDKKQIILPAVMAVGGMFAPAAIYAALNHDDPVALSGWAIPAATDIAFALGILALIGSRVPTSLKILLTSVAIFDDLGAILIIAGFYTETIDFHALSVVGICLLVLLFVNYQHVESKSLYVLIGVIMWAAMLKSGIHATLAGVLLAMFIPIESKVEIHGSPLKEMEHDLHSVVNFFILPVFAFANAGLPLMNLSLEQVIHPVPMGIALGLFIGKPLGIFVLGWLVVKLKLVELPKSTSWMSLFGLSLLCGVGFTMSLFIGSLAFGESGNNVVFDERLGILLGSLVSGIVGYFVVRASLAQQDTEKSQ
ncbi:MAG: Na+/H+ antiporter NhaA [Pseudomonadota bacterium]|nr:Na+/H+ antiporter NhaA [Pseudomonadota bacterium]